jgi:superfamily I DNA/RNA helicase
MTWLVPPEHLTLEQDRASRLAADQHRLILGAPGSGKTQILLHRARYLLDAGLTSVERLRVLVYTNSLKLYIRSALDVLGIPESSVTTFDSWCKELYQSLVSRKLPYEDGKPDFRTIRLHVLEVFAGTRVPSAGKLPTGPILDVALVDEGQDLDPMAFEILARAARHVTVCMDRKQQIYDNGAPEERVLATLGMKKANLTLLGAYRTCPYIVDVAAALLSDPSEAEAFKRQARTEQTERTTPMLYLATDIEDERRQLVEILRIRLPKDQRVAILLPQKSQAFSLATHLKKDGVNCENPDELDFGTDLPKLMTYHAAKGLTFDSVLLPRLVAGAFRHARDEMAIRRILFVGVTRAVKWVYFSALHDKAHPLVLGPIGGLAPGRLTRRMAGELDSIIRPEPSRPSTSTGHDTLLDVF